MYNSSGLKSTDSRFSELRALVGYYLEYNNYTKPELALKMGVSTATFYRKLLNPNSFTFEEIVKLFNILKLTSDQILKVI